MFTQESSYATSNILIKKCSSYADCKRKRMEINLSFDPLRQNQSFEMIDFRLTDFSSLKFYLICEELLNIYFCKICEEVLFCLFL